jgi:hypothetical protein
MNQLLLGILVHENLLGLLLLSVLRWFLRAIPAELAVAVAAPALEPGITLLAVVGVPALRVGTRVLANVFGNRHVLHVIMSDSG